MSADDLPRIKAAVQHLVDIEEQRRKQAQRRRSGEEHHGGGGSMASAFSTLSARSRGQSSAAVDSDTLLRSETMWKQGGRVRVWRQRYFVLRGSAGLAYFLSEEAWRQGEPPLGKIHFLDMLDVTGRDRAVAAEVPISLMRLIGMGHVFCVHTESRTYSIAAPSRGAAQDWAAAVNAAWRAFRRSHRRRDRLLGQMWRVPEEGLLEVAERLKRGAHDVDETVRQMFERLELDYMDQITARRRVLLRARCFYAWKLAARHLRKRRLGDERRQSLEANQGPEAAAAADRAAALARRNGGSFFSKRASRAKSQLGAILGLVHDGTK